MRARGIFFQPLPVPFVSERDAARNAQRSEQPPAAQQTQPAPAKAAPARWAAADRCGTQTDEPSGPPRRAQNSSAECRVGDFDVALFRRGGPVSALPRRPSLASPRANPSAAFDFSLSSCGDPPVHTSPDSCASIPTFAPSSSPTVPLPILPPILTITTRPAPAGPRNKVPREQRSQRKNNRDTKILLPGLSH